MVKRAGKKRFRSQGSLQQEVPAGLGNRKGGGSSGHTGGLREPLESRTVAEWIESQKAKRSNSSSFPAHFTLWSLKPSHVPLYGDG